MSYSQTFDVTADTSQDRPATWNPLDCLIECFGAGGSAGVVTDDRGSEGILGVSGAGGDYANISNIDLPAAVNVTVGRPVLATGQQPGPGGDSSVSAPLDGVFVLARGGNSLTPSSVGATVHSGGFVTSNSNVGGGGAGGPAANGLNFGSSPVTTGGAGNGGAGGAGGLLNNDGAANVNGGGGSGKADGTPAATYGGFPGGGSGATTDDEGHTDTWGGAGLVRFSWNPA